MHTAVKTDIFVLNGSFFVSSANRMLTANTIVPDPMNLQTLNRYSYVNNRPTVMVDPSGHIACIDGDPDLGCTDEPITEQKQENSPPFEDWEYMLMALVMYFETQDVPEHAELIAWVILNRLESRHFGNNLEDILVNPNFHVSLRDNGENGIFAYYVKNGISGEELATAAFGFYTNSFQGGKHKRGIERAFELAKQVAMKKFAGHDDPTKGGLFFAHSSPGADASEWAQTSRDGLRNQAEIDGLSDDLTVVVIEIPDRPTIIINNIYSPPYGTYPLEGGYCSVYQPATCNVSGNYER